MAVPLIAGLAASAGAAAFERLDSFARTVSPKQVHAASKDKAKTTANEFESVFLSNMMKSMFTSLEGNGPMGSGGKNEAWRSMLIDQYANNIVKSGGIGISDQVYRQMIAMQAGATK